MKKKQILVLSTLTSLMTIGFTLAVTHVNGITDFAFGQGNGHNHTIYLYGDSVTPGEYDLLEGIQPFSLYKEDAIVVSQSEKYPIASLEFDGENGTYYQGVSDESITWNTPNADPTKPNYIADMVWNSNALVFEFLIIDRAHFDCEESYVYAYDETEGELIIHFFDCEHGTEDATGYAALVDEYLAGDSVIHIEYIKLVFSC